MKSVSCPPICQGNHNGERGTNQIEMITVLETVIQFDDPFRSTGRVDKRGGLQYVPFSTDMPLLTFS